MDSLQIAETKATEEGSASLKMLAHANGTTISTQEGQEQGATARKAIKDYIKRVDGLRKELVDPLNATVKRINDLFRPALDTAGQADKVLGQKMGVFQTEQENQIRIQEAKAREAAEKERVKLDQQADRLESKGKPDQAQAKREEAEAVPTPVFAPPPKPKDAYFREEWHYAVTKESEIPDEYWVVDHKMLAKVVKDMKGTKEIPGIRQFPEKITVSK